MDSIPLSQPAPSHTNTPTSARQRALLSSIFNASRNGTRTNDGVEGPYRMIDDSSAGRRHGRRLGTGTFSDHAGRLGARVAALTSRSRSRSRGEPTGHHYVSTGSYIPINLHSRTADNHWGDRATSSSETRSEAHSGRSRRDGRTRNRQPRRRHEGPELVGRSCTSVIGQKGLRKKLYTLAIAGVFFIVVLSIYIAFSASHAQIGRELRILLIFMLLILAIVFCHSFVRFALAIARGPIVINRNRIPSQIGPGGYAEPNQPIPVALAADEEAMAEGDGNIREKVTAPPPAYGLWRSSVRINPDLLHWQRVENAPASRQNLSRKTPAPRPPSYASDNGVDYVIEAQPRSCVPDRDRVSEHP